MSTPAHVELFVDSLSLELGADGRADVAAVRRALDQAIHSCDDLVGLHDRPVAEVVAREVAREVNRMVPPC